MKIRALDFGSNKYRTAYVVQPAHDYTLLQKHCDRIKFMTSGYEDAIDIVSRLKNELEDYDPTLDVIVPSGRTYANLILGMFLIASIVRSSIILALFSRDNGYNFFEVYND